MKIGKEDDGILEFLFLQKAGDAWYGI